MEMTNSKDKLIFDLYHGTSSLFLEDIIDEGLGGKNPVKDWDLVKLSKEVYDLSEKYISDSKAFKVSGWAFKKMTKQSNAIGMRFNYQHGDTYLSPNQDTAAKYAIHKKFGSEILTYILKFLDLLTELDLQEVNRDLYHKCPEIFKLIEVRPAPILFKVKNVNVNTLLNENGEDPGERIKVLNELWDEDKDLFKTIGQQANFRLTEPVFLGDIEIFLINQKNSDPYFPKYELYRIDI